MKNALVSIIIPTYNRAYLICETLDSIIAQTYINWECIMVDDGSTDGTIEILKRYCKNDNRFKYYKRPKERPKGANACRNYGFELSKGDYIQWFDSDDLMHIDKLKNKVNLLQKSEADFIVCEGIEYKDIISNVICNWDKISSNNVLFDHVIGNVNFHTNGPLFKRNFLKNKKLFNEILQRKQEWEFYSRLLTFSTNYLPLKQKLYYFSIHENSINGKNEITTLKSRIKATNLVFKNVKDKLSKMDLMTLRKHFLYKSILHFKLAKDSKDYRLILYSLKSIFIFLNLKMFIGGILKLISKPRIISNIFK